MKIKILGYVCFMHFILTYVIECLMMFGFLSLNTNLATHIDEDIKKQYMKVPKNTTSENPKDRIIRIDNIMTYINPAPNKIEFFYIGYVISFI